MLMHSFSRKVYEEVSFVYVLTHILLAKVILESTLLVYRCKV